MTGAAGALIMFGGMVLFAVIVTTLDYLAGRREEKELGRGSEPPRR